MRRRIQAWILATPARIYAAIGIALWIWSASIAWAITHGTVLTVWAVICNAAAFWINRDSDRP